MKHKLIALILAAALVFCLAACGSSDTTDESDSDVDTAEEIEEEIAVVEPDALEVVEVEEEAPAEEEEEIFGIGDTWTIDDQWSMTVTSIEETDYRYEYSDQDPGAVYYISFTYTNLGYVDDEGIWDGLFIDLGDASIVDSEGVMGAAYPGNVWDYPLETPVGATCNAESCICVDNPGVVTLYFSKYDGNQIKQSATFVLDPTEDSIEGNDVQEDSLGKLSSDAGFSLFGRQSVAFDEKWFMEESYYIDDEGNVLDMYWEDYYTDGKSNIVIDAALNGLTFFSSHYDTYEKTSDGGYRYTDSLDDSLYITYYPGDCLIACDGVSTYKFYFNEKATGTYLDEYNEGSSSYICGGSVYGDNFVINTYYAYYEYANFLGVKYLCVNVRCSFFNLSDDPIYFNSEDYFQLNNGGMITSATSTADGYQIAGWCYLTTTITFVFPYGAGTDLSDMTLIANGKEISLADNPYLSSDPSSYIGIYYTTTPTADYEKNSCIVIYNIYDETYLTTLVYTYNGCKTSNTFEDVDVYEGEFLKDSAGRTFEWNSTDGTILTYSPYINTTFQKKG